MHLIIAIVVVLAVLFLALVVYGIISLAVERYKERYVMRTVQDLGDMFLFIDPRQLFVLNLAAMTLLVGLGLLFFGPFATLVMGVAGFFTPFLAMRYYRRRRVARFNVQLTNALTGLAGALKAGLSLTQAVEAVAREESPPLSQEFSLFVKEVKLGVSLEDALNNMAQRVGSEDLDLLVTSTNIARSLGGNLAEMFETIAETIRERFRLEGKIQALTSQGKLQGWIVAALPLALGLVLDILRPDLMEPMLNHWFGYLLIAAIIVMEALGIFFIRKIVNIDV